MVNKLANALDFRMVTLGIVDDIFFASFAVFYLVKLSLWLLCGIVALASYHELFPHSRAVTPNFRRF